MAAAGMTMLASTSIATPASLAVKDLKLSAKSGVAVPCAPSRLSVRSSAESEQTSRREVVKMAGAMFALGLFGVAGNAKAGLVEDLLAKSAMNKALNDKKRLATSGANVARAFTVQNGTCSFPYNFTGCEDLAKVKNVKFLTEDLEIECEGKEAYKCGSNVFWKGK